MKQKKKLTVKQQQKRYRIYQYLTLAGEVLCIFIPYAVMIGVNYNKWFITNPDGVKVGIGTGLALALGFIALALFTKKKDKESSITNGWIAFIVGWFAVAFVFVLLNSIMNEIATMMLYGGIGLCAACGLDFVSRDFKNKADTIKEVMGDTQKDTLKEKYKKELEEEEKDIDPVE